MSKAVLISIRPKWCELIASGKKTIEVRKSRPKLETPFKCYIYCTNSGRPLVYGDKPCADGWTEAYTQTYGYSREEADKIWGVMNGKVIGEFVCDRMDTLSGRGVATEEYLRDVCLTVDQYNAYRKGRATYFWHISDLVIYDEPKKLSEFVTGSSVFTYNKDGNIVYSGMKRPPQSWCYVETLENEKGE